MIQWWHTALQLAAEEREQTGQAVSEQLHDFIICMVAMVLGVVEIALVLAMGK